MSEPRQIAVVTAADGYAGILRAFRDRQAQLGLSTDKIDEITQGENHDPRYATKWLSGMRGLGPKSWGDALGSMAMKIVFVEDEKQLERLKKHLQTRNGQQVRTNVRIRLTSWLFTSRSGRRIAKKREAGKTKAERSRAARHASNIRWKRERARRKAARLALQITHTGAQHDAG